MRICIKFALTPGNHATRERHMHLPYPLGLILSASRANQDAERTDFAQRKSGRGIRLMTRGNRVWIVRAGQVVVPKAQQSWVRA